MSKEKDLTDIQYGATWARIRGVQASKEANGKFYLGCRVGVPQIVSGLMLPRETHPYYTDITEAYKSLGRAVREIHELVPTLPEDDEHDEHEAPISPGALIANHLQLSGGPATNMTDSEFVALLRKSVLYWEGMAGAAPEHLRKPWVQPSCTSNTSTESDMSFNPMLSDFSAVLNLHQDIEDVFHDSTLTANEKLAKIQEINNELGKLCAATLPG